MKNCAMSSSEFAEYRNLVAISRLGSFTKAAADLGISISTLSLTVKNLETRVGLALVNRTTRSVSLTEVGESLVQRIRPALEDIADAVDVLNVFREKPAGALRICATAVARELVLKERLADFCAKFPDVQVDLRLVPASVDISNQQCDVGLASLDTVDQDMIAVAVTPPLNCIIAAAPDYLDRMGRPKVVGDLSAHAHIKVRSGDGRHLREWFSGETTGSQGVKDRTAAVVTDLGLARSLAVSGVGLVCAPRDFLANALADGELEQVLPGEVYEAPPIAIFFPRNRSAHNALRAFIDHFRLVH